MQPSSDSGKKQITERNERLSEFNGRTTACVNRTCREALLTRPERTLTAERIDDDVC